LDNPTALLGIDVHELAGLEIVLGRTQGGGEANISTAL
jgi:hypothetical protein